MRRNSVLSAVIVSSALMSAANAIAADFNWENLALAWMKLSPDFEYSDRRVESYMQTSRRETWDAVHNNEFKLQKARAETLAILKRKVSEYKLDDVIVLNTEFNLAKYDFSLQAFPIENMTETHYWYPSSRYSGDLPSNFNVFFSNTEPFRQVKLDEAQAEAFIRERTDRGGYVNRSVPATIRFRIKSLKNSDGAFLAEIQSITVFRDRTKTRALAELTAPPPKRESEK